MKKVFILAFIFLGFNVNAIPVAMEAKVYNPKEFYLSGEPIWVEYFVYNASRDTVWIESMMLCGGGNVDFRLFNEETGKKLPVGGWHIQLRGYGEKYYNDVALWKRMCMWISPGDTLHGFYDLTMNYSLFSPGRYHLKSTLFESLIRDKGAPDYPPFWKGKLEAPIDFVITVKEPERKEKKAQRLFFEARKAQGEVRKKIGLYSKFLQLYPHSVYSPKAQDLVVYYARKLADPQKASQQEVKKEIEKLINLYPDSPYALDYIHGDRIYLQR